MASQPDHKIADSPAAESIRVDPESVTSEFMKSLLPSGSPLPVFSTMALIHGTEASGANALRKGFTWNSQMDLLWALGYPEVLLIVDGFPEQDTPDAMLEYWDPEKKSLDNKSWRRCALTKNRRCISRRGAWAILYELETRKNPFTLSKTEMLKVSEPRELSNTEAHQRMLAATWHHDVIRSAAFVLEALAGPDGVITALCEIVTNKQYEDMVRIAAMRIIPPMLRRIPNNKLLEVRDQLALIPNTETENLIDLRDRALASSNYIQEKINNNQHDIALSIFNWVDEDSVLVAQTHNSFLKKAKPGIPQTRIIFPGGDSVIEQEAAYFKKYDKKDYAQAFMDDYSTINHSAFIDIGKTLGKGSELKNLFSPWLNKHISK